MAYPLRKDVSDPWTGEPYQSAVILRPTRRADGRVEMVSLPPTRGFWRTAFRPRFPAATRCARVAAV